MLLMVQYLQGTRRSVQTWTIHGDAVRAAFQLGLHSSETLAQFGPLEQEMRIRTWYCCVVLDRSVSYSHQTFLFFFPSRNMENAKECELLFSGH